MQNECENCEYYGRPSDAPESTEKDCLFWMIEESDISDTLPCEEDRHE